MDPYFPLFKLELNRRSVDPYFPLLKFGPIRPSVDSCIPLSKFGLVISAGENKKSFLFGRNIIFRPGKNKFIFYLAEIEKNKIK